MVVDSLRMHLVEELADLLDAEHQLTESLPKMAASATTSRLKTAFRTHLKETRGHINRLNKAVRQLGEKPRRRTCAGMQGLLTKGEEVMNQTSAGALRAAVMITAAQKVELLGEKGVAGLSTRKPLTSGERKRTTQESSSVRPPGSDLYGPRLGSLIAPQAT